MLAIDCVPQGPFGVVLNANAGRVTPRLASAIRRVVNTDHVFLTESKDHSEEVLRLCVEREYSTVFAGGGDGTIVDAINTLSRLGERGARVPAVGVLRLGTGNALAHWLGSGNPVRDLKRFQNRELHQARPVRMITTDGTLYPFGGAGHDAAVLNDYYTWKKRFADTRFAGLFSGLTGYFLAGFGRTVPRYLTEENPEVTIYNLGRSAYRVGANGDEIGEPVPQGGVLYRGSCAAVGAGTTPQLGYGLRYFPYACRRAGRFHLRVVDMSALQCVANLPSLFRGTLGGPQVHDFYADRVRLVFNRAMPFQMAGDPAGFRNEIVLGLSESPVTLIGQA